MIINLRFIFLFTLSFCVLAFTPNRAISQTSRTAVPETRGQMLLSFSPLVKLAAPSVVQIFTSSNISNNVNDIFNDPFFKRFFGNNLFGDNKRTREGLGSGVILTSDGIIITNAHVIEGGDNIKVQFPDKREFEAEILMVDRATDLALLKVDNQGVPFKSVTLGNSDSVEIGDLTLAIGNPFGVGQTVTTGVVSALARTEVGSADFRSYIQTDAAINPGNSGGALLDIQGRLIGINTAIFSRSGGSLGIGFAVPVKMVKRMLEAEERGVPFYKPWLGFTPKNIDTDTANREKLRNGLGVVVSSIAQEGPAAKAGLRNGNVILSVNGKPIAGDQDFKFIIASERANVNLNLKGKANSKDRSWVFRVELPPKRPAPDYYNLTGSLKGATVANVSPAIAQEFGLPEASKGVIIYSLDARSRLYRLGLRAGDSILSFDQNPPVNNTKEVAQYLNSKASYVINILKKGQIIRLEISP